MKRTLVAIAAGLALGAMMLVFQGPSYAFLPEARVVARQSARLSDGVRAHATQFVARENAEGVLTRIRAAFPERIEQTARDTGSVTIRVPRRRTNGSIDVTFPPAQEIVVTLGDPASVVVREYRTPDPIDQLVDWVGRRLHS